MYSYSEYTEFCKTAKRQPLNEAAYNALIAINFCPIRSEYVKDV